MDCQQQIYVGYPNGNLWDPRNREVIREEPEEHGQIFSPDGIAHGLNSNWRSYSPFELAVIGADNVVRFRVNQLSPHLVLVFAEGMQQMVRHYLFTIYTVRLFAVTLSVE